MYPDVKSFISEYSAELLSHLTVPDHTYFLWRYESIIELYFHSSEEVLIYFPPPLSCFHVSFHKLGKVQYIFLKNGLGYETIFLIKHWM